MTNRSADPNVYTDSGVYQEGQGYERLILVRGWDTDEPQRLARIHIRVDRVPDLSFARLVAYEHPITLDEQPAVNISLPPADFWREMPGYLRWANDSSEDKTWALAERLVKILVDRIVAMQDH